MLPLSLATEEAKQMQQQAKRDLAISMSSSSSSGGASGSGGQSVLAIGARKEELRFVPLSSVKGSKSCNITISNMQPRATAGVHHQIHTALKSKLTTVNILPKTLKTGTGTGGGSSTTGSAPLFQLVPSPNNPSQPLVAILAPPRKPLPGGGGGAAAPNNAQPVVIRSGPALNKAQLTIHNGIATMTPAPTPAAAAGGTSGGAPGKSLLAKSELPQKSGK